MGKRTKRNLLLAQKECFLEYGGKYKNKSCQKTTKHVLWELASHGYKVNGHISGAKKCKSQ